MTRLTICIIYVTRTTEISSTAGVGEYTCKMSMRHWVKLWTIWWQYNDLKWCTFILVIRLFHTKYLYEHDFCKDMLIISIYEGMNFAMLLMYIPWQNGDWMTCYPFFSLLFFVFLGWDLKIHCLCSSWYFTPMLLMKW